MSLHTVRVWSRTFLPASVGPQTKRITCRSFLCLLLAFLKMHSSQKRNSELHKPKDRKLRERESRTCWVPWCACGARELELFAFLISLFQLTQILLLASDGDPGCVVGVWWRVPWSFAGDPTSHRERWALCFCRLFYIWVCKGEMVRFVFYLRWNTYSQKELEEWSQQVQGRQTLLRLGLVSDGRGFDFMWS